MITRIVSVAIALMIAPTATHACAPAPSCWIESGPVYLRDVCKGYAKDHRTLEQIASFLEEPERVGEFATACGKYNIHFRDTGKNCFIDGRAPQWAVKRSRGIAMSATDPIWQHATCDAATHYVEWNLPH